MNNSQLQACKQLLGLLINTHILTSLIKGDYFNQSEYKVIRNIILDDHKESDLATLLDTYQPTFTASKRSNQLVDKLIGLVPLYHAEILKTNRSWVAKNLNFGLQSSIASYLSKISKPTFISVKKAIEPRSSSAKHYDNLSLASFELGTLLVESNKSSVSMFADSMQLLKQRFNEVYLETEIMLYLNSIFRHFQKSASLSNEYVEESLDYYNKYSHLLTETTNPKIYFYVSQLGIMHALLIPNYELVIERCLSALDGLENTLEVQNSTHIRVVRNRLIEAYLQSGLYDEAASELNKTGKQANVLARIRQTLLRILIYIKNDQHSEAVELFIENDTSYIRKQLTTGIKYNFDLVRNIVYIIAALKEMDPKYLPAKRTLRTMLNVDSDSYNDKSGLNLAHIVTDWVLMIMNRDIDMMEMRETSLERYLARHVRDKKNYRAKCMLRMLKTVHRSNFDIQTIKIRTSISYNRLKRTKPDGTFQAMELEIISYEQLWHLLLEYIGSGKTMYSL